MQFLGLHFKMYVSMRKCHPISSFYNSTPLYGSMKIWGRHRCTWNTLKVYKGSDSHKCLTQSCCISLCTFINNWLGRDDKKIIERVQHSLQGMYEDSICCKILLVTYISANICKRNNAFLDCMTKKKQKCSTLMRYDRSKWEFFGFFCQIWQSKTSCYVDYTAWCV